MISNHEQVVKCIFPDGCPLRSSEATWNAQLLAARNAVYNSEMPQAGLETLKDEIRKTIAQVAMAAPCQGCRLRPEITMPKTGTLFPKRVIQRR